MGRVRTRTVKRASRHIIERFYSRLTLDFDTNKRVCDEIATIQSKRLRNKIAGFTTVRSCSSSRLVVYGAARGFPSSSYIYIYIYIYSGTGVRVGMCVCIHYTCLTKNVFVFDTHPVRDGLFFYSTFPPSVFVHVCV